MLEGDAEDSKIIRTAIKDCDSDHAYQQDLGIGSDMVFDILSPEGQSRVMRKVKRVFEAFRAEQRFKLVNGSLRVVGDTEAELTLEFKYINLESDEEQTFREALVGLQNPGTGV